MSNPSKLGKAIAAKARQLRIQQAEERSKAKRKARERQALAEANALTPDGFTPSMRAKLQDASKRAHEDPRAKAIVEDAALQIRIERLRRDTGIGNVSPPVFAGEPIDPKLIPPSVGEALSKQERKKKP